MQQSGSEWPILPDSQLFQSIATKVTQNYSEWLISPNSQLFQSFHTEVTQNDSEWPILPDSQLFPSFPTEVAQNDLEQPISPDSQLFQYFSTKVAQNDLEWPILQKKKKKNTMIQPIQQKKKRNTMIQGNFYERLHFSIDSCAISPMASLYSIAFMFIPIFLRLEGNVPPHPEMKKLDFGSR